MLEILSDAENALAVADQKLDEMKRRAKAHARIVQALTEGIRNVTK